LLNKFLQISRFRKVFSIDENAVQICSQESLRASWTEFVYDNNLSSLNLDGKSYQSNSLCGQILPMFHDQFLR